MRNVKLIIEYDGTNYHGWQKQKNAKTVQDTIERAIKGLTGEKVDLIGASRTDFGVHALGQVANFITNSGIPGDRFSYALNRMLPDDIVIKESQEVDMDFHARYKAKGKSLYNLQYLLIQPQKQNLLLQEYLQFFLFLIPNPINEPK